MASALFSPMLRHPATIPHFSLQLASQQLPGLLAPLHSPAAFQPRRLPQFLLPLASTTFANLSSFLSTLWDSILLAVPKKKTPYSKKRSRQLAGKALKDVTHLNRCSGCGRVKRMHILCPYCVQNIKDMWAGRLTRPSQQPKARSSGSTTARKQPTSSSTEVTTTKKK